MASYFRNYMQNFGTIEGPITNLLQKGCAFVWDKERQKVFEEIQSSNWLRSHTLYIHETRSIYEPSVFQKMGGFKEVRTPTPRLSILKKNCVPRQIPNYKPFNTLHMDHSGLFVTSMQKHAYLIIVMDARNLSSYGQCQTLKWRT